MGCAKKVSYERTEPWGDPNGMQVLKGEGEVGPFKWKAGKCPWAHVKGTEKGFKSETSGEKIGARAQAIKQTCGPEGDK